MKIGVLSDTHLHRVTPDFRKLCQNRLGDVDLILHAGDMVELEVYDFLASLKPRVEAVQGNMDEGKLRGRLPMKKVLNLEGLRIGLIHGWGPAAGLEERLRPEFEEIDCLVFGHSHKAAHYRQGGILFFNPGSASGKGFWGKPTLGYLHLKDSKIEAEIVEL